MFTVAVLLAVNHYLAFSYFASVWHPFSEVWSAAVILLLVINLAVSSAVRTTLQSVLRPHYTCIMDTSPTRQLAYILDTAYCILCQRSS